MVRQHHRLNMNLSKLWKMVKDREAWHAAVHGVPKTWIQLSNLANWVCLATEQQQQQILSQETKRNKLPWCKSCVAKNCGLYLFVESSCWLRCSKKTDFSHIVTRKLLLPTTWMNLEADSFLFQPPDEDTTWPTSWSVALYDETEDLLKPTRLLTCDKWELLNVCWLML